jgi:hypothetical protein
MLPQPVLFLPISFSTPDSFLATHDAGPSNRFFAPRMDFAMEPV